MSDCSKNLSLKLLAFSVSSGHYTIISAPLHSVEHIQNELQSAHSQMEGPTLGHYFQEVWFTGTPFLQISYIAPLHII